MRSTKGILSAMARVEATMKGSFHNPSRITLLSILSFTILPNRLSNCVAIAAIQINAVLSCSIHSLIEGRNGKNESIERSGFWGLVFFSFLKYKIFLIRGLKN